MNWIISRESSTASSGHTRNNVYIICSRLYCGKEERERDCSILTNPARSLTTRNAKMLSLHQTLHSRISHKTAAVVQLRKEKIREKKLAEIRSWKKKNQPTATKGSASKVFDKIRAKRQNRCRFLNLNVFFRLLFFLSETCEFLCNKMHRAHVQCCWSTRKTVTGWSVW